MLRPLPALLAALSALLLPSAAQDGGSVSLQFLSFPRQVDPEPVELVTGEGRTIEVEIPTNQLSKTYKVPRLGTWAVGKTEAGPDGEPAFTTWGKAKALSSGTQLLLLVRKGDTYEDGFEVIPVDSRATQFGGGKFLFMNAADVDVAGEVGADKFALKPGAHTILQPRSEEGDRTFHTTLWFRIEDKPKPFFSSTWPLSESARALIFFYHDPENQRLRLHTIRDFGFGR